MCLQSKSTYPSVGLLDIGAFCQESHIIDAKMQASNVDRQFISATSSSPAAEELVSQLKKIATKSEMIKL